MTDDHNPNIDSYQEYRRRINLMADAIEEYVTDLEDSEYELTQLVFEEVDSCRMVIYTHEAINVLKHSDSQPEEWKHLVADGEPWQKVITAMAFDIVRQDLWEELNRRDIE